MSHQDKSPQTMSPAVILLDDDAEVLEALAETFELAGFTVRPCTGWPEARAHIAREMAGVVLTDVRMPGRDGFDALGDIHAVDPEIPVVLISGHADVPMAVRAMQQGAYDFVEKPADPAYLVELIRRASEHRALVLAHRQLREVVQTRAIDGRIIGTAPAIVRLREMTLALAQVDATVLIFGQTGTGKELVARSLHDFGTRARGPFVAINCGALPPTILESELFGHEAGAFTGAKERRIGKIEQAHLGTLFLDEIESMSMEAQMRLLRVLQERSLERLGGQREIKVDVRVVAATKVDLVAQAAKGLFREDLVYRLNVVPLTTPPLRERGTRDIELLFRHYFDEAAAKLGPRAAPCPALDALARHGWPGNVRELRNAAERAALGFPILPGAPEPVETAPGRSLAALVASHERREIEMALARGRQLQQVAADLGISRKTLYLKMREHGLSAAGDAELQNG
jgi:two-component system C4-dicarboxylate transport response regulator DctD